MPTLTLALTCLTAAIAPPSQGHYALDTTGRIGPATLQTLDQLGARVNGTGAGQLAVLVVKTTNGVPPRLFAKDVFNSWGVGHRGHDNGILLFVALDDRKAEIVLGDGLTRISTGDTDAVMANHVVRNFKAGKPEQALIDGSIELAELLTHAAPALAPQEVSQQDALAEAEVGKLFVRGEVPDPSPRGWVIDLTGEVPEGTVHAVEKVPNDLYVSDARPLFVVFFRSRKFDATQVRDRAGTSLRRKHPTAAVLAVNLEKPDSAFGLPAELLLDGRGYGFEHEVAQAALFAPTKGDVTEATQRAQAVLRDGFPAPSPKEVVDQALARHGPKFAGFGGLLLIGGLLYGRRWNRYRARACETCHRPRQMLPAGAEDKHLSAGQQAEQSVGSVDYDVWWCGVCRTVLIRDNSAWFSGYSRCDGCHNRTLQSTSTTLSHATEWSTGSVRIDEKCAHCSHTRSYTRTTARLTRTSSSSSSSSFSSSSRSSGSSFGGGSSSGRGSSGSW